ncbi:hypothetical protein DVH24_006771 [Malus domestica]|uniref:Uncharacterized protein n=1 Tax=Malus domestica TaxID=3750 RepID=A0A498J6L9_MALDO|nr:hypothetical protein DVH24_006771 [Malus domestica]
MYKVRLLYFVHYVVLGKENDSAIDYHLVKLVDNEKKMGDMSTGICIIPSVDAKHIRDHFDLPQGCKRFFYR